MSARDFVCIYIYVCVTGHMTATVRGPTRPIPAEVHDRGDGKPTLLFTPEEKGELPENFSWSFQ